MTEDFYFCQFQGLDLNCPETQLKSPIDLLGFLMRSCGLGITKFSSASAPDEKNAFHSLEAIVPRDSLCPGLL